MELKLIFLIVDILLFITWSYYFFVWEKKKLTVGVGIGIAVNWIVLLCIYIFVRTPTDGDNGTKDGHESYHDSKKQAMRNINDLAKTATKILGDNGTKVYIIDNFMTQDECNKIIDGSQGNMTPSTLTRASDDPDYRNSETCYFNGTPIQTHVNKKICDAMGINNNMSEPCQIQHYKLGNQFKEHHDFFHRWG